MVLHKHLFHLTGDISMLFLLQKTVYLHWKPVGWGDYRVIVNSIGNSVANGSTTLNG